MIELEKNDTCFPEILKKIPKVPERIYVEGVKDLLNINCISVVGSRNCTEYGRKWCEKAE